jgi:hypothetical protein
VVLFPHTRDFKKFIKIQNYCYEPPESLLARGAKNKCNYANEKWRLSFAAVRLAVKERPAGMFRVNKAPAD